jgi:hypothetical protein
LLQVYRTAAFLTYNRQQNKSNKVQNLSRISEYNKRGLQALARKGGEIMRRKLTSEGEATLKFYIF